MHISYSLHSLDCNLADGEYVLIPEQGAIHEEDQEHLKASPGFMHNRLLRAPRGGWIGDPVKLKT
jgi:hypothetical protein